MPVPYTELGNHCACRCPGIEGYKAISKHNADYKAKVIFNNFCLFMILNLFSQTRRHFSDGRGDPRKSCENYLVGYKQHIKDASSVIHVYGLHIWRQSVRQWCIQNYKVGRLWITKKKKKKKKTPYHSRPNGRIVAIVNTVGKWPLYTTVYQNCTVYVSFKIIQHFFIMQSIVSVKIHKILLYIIWNSTKFDMNIFESFLICLIINLSQPIQRHGIHLIFLDFIFNVMTKLYESDLLL